MTNTTDFQAQLKALRDAYAAQLPEKLQHIEQAWKQLSGGRLSAQRDKVPWDEQGFETLHRMLHSLSGSGKTFGFAALSEVAHELEAYLQPLIQEKTPLNAEQRKHIQVLLNKVIGMV